MSEQNMNTRRGTMVPREGGWVFSIALVAVVTIAAGQWSPAHASGSGQHTHTGHASAVAKADQHRLDETRSHGHEHGHAHWSAPSEAAARRNPIHADEISVARGQSVFQHRCVACHGVAGRGDGPAAAALATRPADLVVMMPRHTDGDLAWKIANGRGSMPAWKKVLSEPQIWDVINYLRDLARAGLHRTGQSSHAHQPNAVLVSERPGLRKGMGE